MGQAGYIDPVRAYFTGLAAVARLDEGVSNKITQVGKVRRTRQEEGGDAVVRRVIDDDDVVVRIVLVQEAGQRDAQLLRPIHDAENDRHRLRWPPQV